MIKEAIAYLQKGISVIPVNKLKVPTIKSWTKFQSELMTIADAEIYFQDAEGIATIGGKVSGGREMIDIDCKYDLTGTLFENYAELIRNHAPNLIDKLVIVRTPSNGYHLIYRIDGECSKNCKLANRYCTDEEVEHNPHEKVKVLIEIKAEKGYCLAPPTPGYEFQSLRTEAIIISADERDLLLTLARSFNQVIESEVVIPKKIKDVDDSSFIDSPFDDYNLRGDVLTEFTKHGWTIVSENSTRFHLKRPGDTSSKTSGTYHKELNKFYCFSTSTQFESEKAYSKSAVYCLLNCNNDWTKCFKELLNAGYGRVRKQIKHKYASVIYSMKNDHAEKDEIIDELRKLDGLSINDCAEIIDNYEANQGKKIAQFWEVIPNKDKKPTIKIQLHKFTQFISNHLNIYRYKIDNTFRYVKIEKGLIEEVKITDIKDAIYDYIMSLSYVFDSIMRDDLLEIVQQRSNTLFSEAQMEFVEYTNAKILKSDKYFAYFPFTNGVARVSFANGIELLDYNHDDIKNYVVWKSSVIKHELDLNYDFADHSFYKFIMKINNDDIERADYCMNIIGYLLHDYKDEMKPYCIIFGEESSSNKVGGGTGKGLLTKAVSKMVKTVTIDGKGFEPTKAFAFQRVTIDTKIILLQDTERNMPFESLFSKITDGLTVEKKNKDELFIDYENSPKFLITTNYNIDNESQAANRRQFLLEFSNFFNDKNTPVDYLGEHLFLGWDTAKWNTFYTFMLGAVQFYLSNDLKKMKESETSIQKRISDKFTSEFYEWFIDRKVDEYIKLSNLYSEFLTQSEFSEKDYSKNRFSKALESSCKFLNSKLERIKEPITKNMMVKWNLENIK